MEGATVKRRKRGIFFKGLALSGLVFISGFFYNQRSYLKYNEANIRTSELENHHDQIITVREYVRGVVESTRSFEGDAEDLSLSIDRRIFNLQSAWSEFRDRQSIRLADLIGPNEAALDAGIEQMALVGLRTAVGLRRGDIAEAYRQSEKVSFTYGDLSHVLAGLQLQLADAAETARADRETAVAGMKWGQSIALGAFFAFASLLLTALLLMGLRMSRDLFAQSAEVPAATTAGRER